MFCNWLVDYFINRRVNIKGENPVTDVKLLTETNYFERDVFANYVEKVGTISPGIKFVLTGRRLVYNNKDVLILKQAKRYYITD